MLSTKRITNWLVLFVTIAIIVTALCGLVYVAVQQNFRQSANDPQIQMAEDAARELSQDAPPESVLPQHSIDISQSLAPFVVVYNATGQPIASSALLDGDIPTPPAGIFDYASRWGEDRVTWQPRPDVRIAAVVAPYNSGFVLAGRSLREVEKREHKLGLQVFLVWLASIAVIVVSLVISILLLLFIS